MTIDSGFVLTSQHNCSKPP